MTKDLYSTAVAVTGGRDGRAEAEDGRLAVALALPETLGGAGQGTNPEQLFAAGFGACFASSVRFAAKGLGLDPGDVGVRSVVSLDASEDGAFGLSVTLAVATPGLTEEGRHKVLAEAERICAYTNATRGNVRMTILPA